jgi:hypothetical protein
VSTAGNERLTALTGAVLVPMLAVEGVSIIALDQLFPVHVVVGLALIPVVLLKLGSTSYRMVRYYLRTAAYRARGAPPMLLRLLGPVLAVSTAVVIGSGVGLIVAGRNGTLRGLHQTSFVVFGVAIAIHTLAHIRTLLPLFRWGSVGRVRIPGARRRWLAVGASLLTGAIIATAVVAADGTATHRPPHHRDRGEARNG